MSDAWTEYKAHYTFTQKSATVRRLRKAGYEEGRDWRREETDGKTTVFYLREGLDRPEDIPRTPKPWRIRARVDGEEVVEVYQARRSDHAAAWFRQDQTWKLGQDADEVEILQVEEA